MSLLDIDGHQLWFEVHGQGPPALLMGGWGTFCHGGLNAAPREILSTRTVITFDYPGIGKSDDSPNRAATTEQYASDAAKLLDHLGASDVDIVGLVGLGACVGQQLALQRPDLTRTLVMTGTWATTDPMFCDQLDGLRNCHVRAGFDAFQLLVASFSFTPEFYNANRDRLIGPDGAWGALRGRAEAHSRLVDACLSHDIIDQLHKIDCPTLVVHAGRDIITRPEMTRLLEDGIPHSTGVMWHEIAHVIAGKQQKVRFDEILRDFYRSNAARRSARSQIETTTSR